MGLRLSGKGALEKLFQHERLCLCANASEQEVQNRMGNRGSRVLLTTFTDVKTLSIDWNFGSAWGGNLKSESRLRIEKYITFAEAN